MKKSCVFLFSIFLVACSAVSKKNIELINDTTEVLEYGIKMAFYHKNLPDISSLFHGNLFKDSILLVTDSLPKRLLPHRVGDLKFKLSSIEQLSELKKAFADSLLPNYLYICCFERTDSDYALSIQSRSCVPYGGGGSIFFHILKFGDSLVIKNQSSNSIN